MVELIDVISPILTLVIAALLTIPILRAIRTTSHKTALTLVWFIAVFAIAGTLVANLASNFYASPGTITLSLTSGVNYLYSSTFLVDTISVFMTILLITISSVVVIYTVFAVGNNEKISERYFAIMLIITAALLGAVLAGDLLTLFIFWEVGSVGAAFLMLYKRNALSINAFLKYLIMITIASALVVFGLSLIYGLTGTLNYLAVSQLLHTIGSNDVLVLAFISIFAGYAIEAAVVPFHFWLPDAYTAAPASSAAFLSALVDQASYYILIRVLLYILLPSTLNWTIMLAIMAALAMIIGNLFALIQTDIKRMVAYICVADVGYNLVAITSQTVLGLEGNLYFLLIGGITTALAFMVVGVANSQGFKSLDDFSGLGKKMPLVCLALVMAGLSFAGVPPFGGFTGKFLVFTAAIESNLSWLAVIGVLTSVLQAAILFRLTWVMYGKKPKIEATIKESKNLLIPIFILAGALIILGIFPNIVLNLIHSVTI